MERHRTEVQGVLSGKWLWVCNKGKGSGFDYASKEAAEVAAAEHLAQGDHPLFDEPPTER